LETWRDQGAGIGMSDSRAAKLLIPVGVRLGFALE